MRGAALPLLLVVAACGHKHSRAELEDRIAELDDENDTLKQQLGEVQDQLEQRSAKADRAAPSSRQASSVATKTRAHAARPAAEDRRTVPARSRREAREAENAAAAAVIAASDARKALAQR